MLHVKNQRYLLISFLLVLIATQLPNKCLLEEPLTDQCLNSISTPHLQKDVIPYMCVITIERSLLNKAQQICKQAYLIDLQSGYRYLKVLLALHKFEKAFQTQYTLFFTSPFSHNYKVMQVINQSQAVFQELQANEQKLNKTLSFFDRAIFYFYNNKLAQSLQNLQNHLSQAGSNSNLIYEHFLMSRLFEVQLQHYQGLNYLSELVKKNQMNHGYLWHIHGNFLMQHLLFEKAIKSFQKATRWFDQKFGTKGFSFTDYNTGLCYEKMGKVQDAIVYYQKSIVKLSSLQALNALGHAHFSLFEKTQDKNQINLAEKYYKKALEVNPQYTVVHFNLGMLELTKNNPYAAQSYFRKCVSLGQALDSCKYGLIKTYYAINQIDQVDPLISTMQLNQNTLAELMAIFYELGDHKKALSLLGQREDFKLSQLYQWKGFNQYKLGLYEKGEKSFQRAIFLGAKKGYIYYTLGLCEMQQKKYAQCHKSFDTAYRIDNEEMARKESEQCKKKSMNHDL